MRCVPAVATAFRDRIIEAARLSLGLQLAKYLQEASRQSGRERDLRALWRWFPGWRRSLHPSRSALADGVPWMSYAAIEFLERTLTPSMRVFEYGAGGSTLFFAARAKGVSVEHDEAWARETRAALQARALDWELLHVAPEPGTASGDASDPSQYRSSDPGFPASTFRAYAESIERFAGDFDLVIVDGRARPSCALHALPKIAKGGFLLLDNAERPVYRDIHRRLATAGWLCTRFSGPAPYLFPFSVACVWQKPWPPASTT